MCSPRVKQAELAKAESGYLVGMNKVTNWYELSSDRIGWETQTYENEIKQNWIKADYN